MKIYPHKSRGYQVWYTIYFPCGEKVKKCRFRKTKAMAEEFARLCDGLETGSRKGDLHQREILRARHEGLLTEAEARRLNGGKAVNSYDLQRVVDQFETSSSVVNTPYGHRVNMNRVGHLRSWLETNPIPRLVEADIKKFVSDRREGRVRFPHPKTGHCAKKPSAKTISLDLQILRQLIDEAVRLGMVESNPARDVQVAVKNKRLRRSLSHDEAKILMAAAKGHRELLFGCLFEITAVGLYCGLRRQEAAYLEWGDLDFSAGRVKVQSKKLPQGCELDEFTPKSGEARSINMPDRLRDILLKHREQVEKKGRFVFGGAMPLRLDTITHGFKSLVKLSGIDPKISYHHLRHTWISWLLRKTGDLSYVKDVSGHSDIETTKNYSHTIFTENAPERDFDFET